MTNKNQVVMYVLMRNDMSSMTPGRACAQATHAANDCVKVIRELETGNISTEELEEWEKETWAFGTTIVLGASLQQIRDLYDLENAPFVRGITNDPEYAVRDGDTVHLIPVDTCMWLFGRRNEIKPYVEHLNLY